MAINLLAFAVLLSHLAAIRCSRREQGLLGPRSSSSTAKRGHLAIHVPDIPTEYRQSMSANELWGLSALGDPKTNSLENEVWTSPGAALDWWFARQLVTSPLRVPNVQDADMVFVPATIRYFTETMLLQKFFEEAPDFLPALRSKPHVLILTDPLATIRQYMPNAAELLLQGNGRYFTYISEECFDREWPDFDYSRLIGAPYMAHIHWHRGSNHLLTETNISDLVQQKKYTALVSAKFRDYDIRFALRDHCAARNESCLVIDWDAHPHWVADDLSMNGSKQAWYQLMPRGDTTLRKSFFHAILTNSIPVVFEDDYFKYAPFADVLDYHDFTETYPGDAILAQNSATQANIVDILEQKLAKTAVMKLENMLEVQHVFQYMMNPAHELIGFNEAQHIDREDDAFTFTMKGLIRQLCNQHAFPDHQCKRYALQAL